MKRIVSGKGSPLRFIVLVFALSAPIWLLEPRDWRITASVGTPLVAALILVYKEDGRAGTRRLTTFNVGFAVFPNHGSHWDPAVAGAITAIVAVIIVFLWGPKTLARYRYAGHL